MWFHTSLLSIALSFKLTTKQQKKIEARKCAAAKKRRKNLNIPKHKKPCDHISLHPEKSNAGVKARYACGKVKYPKPSAPPYHMMNKVQQDKMKSSSKKCVSEKKPRRIECWVCKPKEKFKATVNTLDRNLQFMSTSGSIVSEGGAVSQVCSYITFPGMRTFNTESDYIHKVFMSAPQHTSSLMDKEDKFNTIWDTGASVSITPNSCNFIEFNTDVEN